MSQDTGKTTSEKLMDRLRPGIERQDAQDAAQHRAAWERREEERLARLDEERQAEADRQDAVEKARQDREASVLRETDPDSGTQRLLGGALDARREYETRNREAQDRIAQARRDEEEQHQAEEREAADRRKRAATAAREQERRSVRGY